MVMQLEQQILYIPDIAQLLGRSISSIKNAVHDKAPWLPPFYKSGGRICWRYTTVVKFLEAQEQGAVCPPRKRGRPRKTPLVN